MKGMEQTRLEAERYINRDRGVMAEKKRTETDFYLHWHEYFEVELVLGGIGRQVLNGQCVPLHRGTVSVLTPTDFHELFVEEPLELYNISFDLSAVPLPFLERAVRSEQRVFYPPEAEFARLSHLGFLLSDAFSGEPLEPEYISGLLHCLLTRLSGMIGGENGGAEASHSSDVIQNALLYLHLHFREKTTLDDLSGFVHLSPNYLGELFRQETGSTVTQYLSGLRIGYAQNLLDTTGLSVTDVCFACGYSSLPNFMKYFKQKTGLSPLQYKKAGGA